jgi:predicted CoA-binding protein
MTSEYESFWQFERYAVVGHSAKRPFPRLTYAGLKKNGKLVYAVDPSSSHVDQDSTFADLAAIPGGVDAVVLELPKEETPAWIEKAADAGVKDVWLHMNTDSPEALAVASRRELRLRKGTCAVMYLEHGFSPHKVHGWIMKLLKKY